MQITTRLYFTAMFFLIGTAGQQTAAQTAPPPTLGEATKGQPAIPESSNPNVASKKPTRASSRHPKTQKSLSDSIFGSAKIKESRRESGQIYRIELEHSSGSKQVIEENDSDGQLSSDDNGLDDTPKLSKWKLGSW